MQVLATNQFNEEKQNVLEAIRGSDEATALQNALDAVNREAWEALYIAFYNAVMLDFGKRTQTSFKSHVAREVKIDADDNPFDAFLFDVNEFIEDTTEQRVEEITDTTKGRITETITALLLAGAFIDDIELAIAELYDHDTPIRSRAIGQTEVITAGNAATFLVAFALGGLSMQKQWHAIVDDRTRASHLAVNGEVRGMDETYSNGLRFPGDPRGSAAETINCFPGDTMVQASNVEKAYRRWYDGELVEIVTSLGHKLSGTPNHPILTDRGWIALGALKEGDNVICSSVCQRMTSSNPNVDNIPTKISNIFDSFSNDMVMNRVSSLDGDFHGDGIKGQVDIITTESKLRSNTSNTSVLEQRLKKELTFTNFTMGCLFFYRRLYESIRGIFSSNSLVSGRNQFTPFFRTRFRHPKIQRFTLIPRSDISLKQQPSNNIPGDTKMFSNTLFRVPGIVKIYDFIRNMSMLIFESLYHRFTLGPPRNSALSDPVIDGRQRDFEIISDELRSFPADVKFDTVVKTSSSLFSGYVYNLQTESGMYVANGIVSHNCRCIESYLF